MSHLPNNTAAHLRSDVPLCLALLLLLLLLLCSGCCSAAFFCCRLSKIVAAVGKLAAAGWLLSALW
jgi:hypothetical protein